ncbi:MAG: ATP-binding protein, partial [Desulfobacterales bacterium]|nr:ATP-binding protein [Desulfobacterales bacterium]
MELLELTANVRKSTGKGISKALRRQGLIPGVLYGPKSEPIPISVDTLDIEKLFRIDVHHSTIGTSEEKGTGLGLILCKEFVEKNNGKIWAESETGKG